MSARLRITLLAGAGFLLLQLGWILAVPAHIGIDEFDHALRASSVADGHWQAGNDPVTGKDGRGDLIPVRADVAESVKTACEFRPYTGTYNCTPKESLGNGEVLIASGAARYNPTYYVLVGVVAAPFHGTANLYALRIMTALLCCALFMLVVWLAAARARTRWPIAVLGLAALPTTVYSASIATPNGMEMICGLGVWVALLALADAHVESGPRRSSYAALGLFVVLLVNLHTMGPVWLALIAVAVAILHGPVTVVKALLPRGRVELVTAALTALGVLAEIAWVLTSGANDPASDAAHYTDSPWGYVLNGVLLWPLQAIGAYPMRNDQAPAAVYGIEIAVLLVVAVLAVRRSTLRSRFGATSIFVLFASFLVPTVLTVATFHNVGDIWQGRYGMPFTAGLLVLAGRQLDRTQRQPARLRPFVVPAVGALVVAQLLSQWHVLTTLRGFADVVAGTHWYPPSLVVLAPLAVLAALCWVGVLRPEPAAPPVSAPVRHADLEEVPA